jgi:hypothetical protein
MSEVECASDGEHNSTTSRTGKKTARFEMGLKMAKKQKMTLWVVLDFGKWKL